MANDDYSEQFSPELALKAVRLALASTNTTRFEVFTALAREWQRAVDRGLGTEDLP
jgi:hypothetical protein